MTPRSRAAASSITLGAGLSGVSCTGRKQCTATGFASTRNGKNYKPLAEHWNGKRWSAETTKHTAELDGVACPATGNCTAVGWNDADKVLAAHWNGKAWSDESAVSTQPATFLEGVSCPATTACIAAGTVGTNSGTALVTAPLAEEWTGGTWTALTVPDPGASGDLVKLNSVSCISPTSCTAVGDDQNAAVTADTTVAAPWNGAT